MSDVIRSALTALIDDTEAREDWTDTQVAAQAKGAPRRLTKQDISNYRVKGMKQIVPGKIIALARGLRLPPYTVALAVLADANIEVPFDARSPEQAIEGDHTLTAATRRHLLAILKEERAS